MTYTLLLLPFIFAFCNRQYGGGEKAILPDWASMSIQGGSIAAACYLVAGVSATLCAALAIPLIAGCYIARVFGKGKWYPQARDTSAERERLSPVVDTLSSVIYGKYTSESTAEFAVKYKTLATGIAWSFCSIPKYATLSFLLHSPIAMVAIPATLLVGTIYKICFKHFPDSAEKDQSIPTSEWATGAFIGAVDAVIILLA